MAVSPGLLHYSHEKGEKGGSLSLKFNLVDPEGNKLIDQSFFISVLGNSPAASTANKEAPLLGFFGEKSLSFVQPSEKSNYCTFIPLVPPAC